MRSLYQSLWRFCRQKGLPAETYRKRVKLKRPKAHTFSAIDVYDESLKEERFKPSAAGYLKLNCRAKCHGLAWPKALFFAQVTHCTNNQGHADDSLWSDGRDK